MRKQKYGPQSPSIRAALDFLETNHAQYQDFGSLAEKLKGVAHKPEWKRDAIAMFEQAHVEDAWLHTNQRSGGDLHHKFHIRFKKRESGLSPRLTIHIELDQLDTLREKALGYRSSLSLKNGTRRAAKSGRKPPL